MSIVREKTFTVVILFVILSLSFAAFAEDQKLNGADKQKVYRIDRSVSDDARACIDCHSDHMAGVVADWADSRHAHANITCIDCHKAGPADKDVRKSHLSYIDVPISPIVSPKDCSRCHPAEAAEYARSKHANTNEIVWKIDHWMKHGMNNEIERATGCYHCHGSVVEIEDNGDFAKHTWPNVGVGRINPDGSKGSCSSCHTRHKFSIAEARKPEACGQCHLGPDHPQIEIYKESKHGAIYYSEGDEWNFDAAGGTWTPGIDYRTPTCAVCHMSGVGDVPTTHDVTERLAWETQAPLTVRPNEFKPFPAKTDPGEEREKMKSICLACHSPSWTDGHFDNLDAVVANYNDVYYKPMRAKIDDLYEKGLLSKEKPLDEMLEIHMYELWHHEGRRARFGAAMMAPDYTWWHGFYELKKRIMEMDIQIEELIHSGKPGKVHDVKGTGGSTVNPLTK
jgi:hypothetical protein